MAINKKVIFKKQDYIKMGSPVDLVIPDRYTQIDSFALNGCSNLKTVIVPNSIICISERAFQDCSDLTNVNLPDSIRSIGESCFRGCRKLESIIFPKNLKIIERRVCQDCTRLSPISIPESVDKICDGAFWGCLNLLQITIPTNVKGVDSYVFKKCSRLTNVEIDCNVTAVHYTAFTDCKLLQTKLSYVQSLPAINPFVNKSNSIEGVKINLLNKFANNKDSLELLVIVISTASITYNNTLNEEKLKLQGFIKRNYANSYDIDELYLCVDHIFESHRSINAVYAELVNSIAGDRKIIILSTFVKLYCSDKALLPGQLNILRKIFVAFGEDPKNISSFIASECKYVITPSDIKVDRHIVKFTKTRQSTSPSVETNAAQKRCKQKEKDNNTFSKIDYKRLGSPADLVIPSGYTTIKSKAFYNCDTLKTIIIPDTVRTIEDSAFHRCSNLKAITLPNKLTIIGNFAFWFCANLTTIPIPDSVHSIGKSIFTGCTNLQSIIISKNCRRYDYFAGNSSIHASLIDPLAFINKTKEAPAIIPKDVKPKRIEKEVNRREEINPPRTNTIASKQCASKEDDNIFSKRAYEEMGSPADLVIPDKYVSIKNKAFQDCNTLKTIIIPNSVLKIEDSAFDRCLNLSSITLPNTLTTIGDCAFWFCSNLTTISIPDSVNSIGKYPFMGCSKLKTITISKKCHVYDYFKRNTPMCATLIDPLAKSIQPDDLPTLKSEKYKTGIIEKIKNPPKRINRPPLKKRHSAARNSGVFYCFTNETYVEMGCPEDVVVGNQYSKISSCAFRDCLNLITIDIPSSITTISSNAFKGCFNLKSVTIAQELYTVPERVYDVNAYIQSLFNNQAPKRYSCNTGYSNQYGYELIRLTDYDYLELYDDVYEEFVNEDLLYEKLGPVTIERQRKAKEYAIPQSSDSKSIFNIDYNRLAELESQTEESQHILHNIFGGDDVEKEYIDNDYQSSDVVRSILQILLTNEIWDRSEVERLCKSKGQILGYILEKINDYAFEKVDDVVIEDDGDTIYVVTDYKDQLL